MKKLLFIILGLLISSVGYSQTVKYKCLLQMSNYQGLEAYVVVSLINPQGQYEKTLSVMGDDKQWYTGWKEWKKAMSKKNEKLHAITRASVPAGDRSIVVLEIDEAKLDKGYSLRFESAVEDKNYYVKDVEVPLTTVGVLEKKEGTGFIRYVKLNKVQ